MHHFSASHTVKVYPPFLVLQLHKHIIAVAQLLRDVRQSLEHVSLAFDRAFQVAEEPGIAPFAGGGRLRYVADCVLGRLVLSAVAKVKYR